MGTYRIGRPGNDVWWGTNYGQAYGKFEAESDQAAWEKGQELMNLPSGFGPDSGVLLALERSEMFPLPKLLSGIPAHSIKDKQPGGYEVWVRVAVGIHGTPWETKHGSEPNPEGPSRRDGEEAGPDVDPGADSPGS